MPTTTVVGNQSINSGMQTNRYSISIYIDFRDLASAKIIRGDNPYKKPYKEKFCSRNKPSHT